METLALLILQLAVKAVPIIEAKIAAGDVAPEEQLKIRAAYLAYRDAMDKAFDGPEWEQDEAGGTGGGTPV